MKRARRRIAAMMAGTTPVMACILLMASLNGSTKAAPTRATSASAMPVYPPDTQRGRRYCPATEQIGAASNPTPTLPECTILQMLIPLYSYPYWWDPDLYIWDDVATATDQISITAIVNPINGPGSCPPNTDYQRGISDLLDAGITLLGYVDTDYVSRPISNVTGDVDLYDQCFSIDGIFFDQVASGADWCDYYDELCRYVKSKLNLDLAFLNPGVCPAACYFCQTCCDAAVIFEGRSDDWPPYQCPYVPTYRPERFAVIVHSVPDTDTMKSHIDLAVARNIGYVYITDDTLPNPYDTLPSYWQAEIDYIESSNMCVIWLPLTLRNH